MSAFASLYLLLAAGLSIQDQNPMVSAEVRAASAPIAIADLSKQIGIPMEAMPSTKEDFLIIKVDKVPLKVLMQKISDVTGAEWELSGNTYRLFRNDAIRRKETQQEEARLTLQIKDAVAAMKKRVDANGPLTQQKAQNAADRLMRMQEQMRSNQGNFNWREQQELSKQAPIYRVLQDLVASIPAETLAATPRGKVIVYSTNPNRMQKRMPADLAAPIRSFIQEQKIWATAMKAAKAKGGEEYYFDLNAQDPGERQIGKILLKVSRASGMGPAQPINVRLIVADTKGRQMGSAQESIGQRPEEGNEVMINLAKLGGDEEAIQLKGVSKDLSEGIRKAFEQSMSNGGGEPTFSFPQEVRDVLINIDKREPLALTATDVLFEIGRIKKLNVVANPTDEMIFATSFGQVKELKPATVLGMMRQFNTDGDVNDGWLTVKPGEKSAARNRRADRTALANYIRRTIKEGRLTLDNKASYALASRQEEEDFMPMFFLTVLGLMSTREGDHSDWNALRLYATLTPSQWQAVRANQQLPFRSLQPQQVEIIRHILFDRDYSPIQINYQQEDVADLGTDEPVFYGGGLDQEATELLPNGFTGTEMLQVTEMMQQQLFGTAEDTDNRNINWGEQAMNVDSMAYEIFQDERPEFFPWRNQPGFNRPKMSLFRTGTDRTIRFHAQFTKKASFDTQVNDRVYASKDKVKFDKLPADIKKQVEAALVKLRETYKNQKPPKWDPANNGGGNKPPPPHER